MCKAPLRVSAPTVIPVCDQWNRGKTEVLSAQDGRTQIQGQTNIRPLPRLIKIEEEGAHSSITYQLCLTWCWTNLKVFDPIRMSLVIISRGWAMLARVHKKDDSAWLRDDDAWRGSNCYVMSTESLLPSLGWVSPLPDMEIWKWNATSHSLVTCFCSLSLADRDLYVGEKKKHKQEHRAV